MQQEQGERRKLRKLEDVVEKPRHKQKRRYYNNPQDKKVRARREARGPIR